MTDRAQRVSDRCMNAYRILITDPWMKGEPVEDMLIALEGCIAASLISICGKDPRAAAKLLEDQVVIRVIERMAGIGKHMK